MSTYSVYRTGWEVNADDARKDALSSVESYQTSFSDAVPQEINMDVIRMKQHMRMYEKLYGKKEENVEVPVEQDGQKQEEVLDAETEDKVIEFSSETENEDAGTVVDSEVINDENENIGNEEEHLNVSEEVLLGEGQFLGAMIKEVVENAVSDVIEKKKAERIEKKKSVKKTKNSESKAKKSKKSE